MTSNPSGSPTPPRQANAARTAGLGAPLAHALTPELLSIGLDETLAALRVQALRALDDVQQEADALRALLESADDTQLQRAATRAKHLDVAAGELTRHTAALHAVFGVAGFARPGPSPASS